VWRIASWSLVDISSSCDGEYVNFVAGVQRCCSLNVELRQQYAVQCDVDECYDMFRP